MKASILTSAAIFHLRLRRYQVRRQRHKENLIFFTAPSVLAIKLPCVSRFLTKHVIDASLSLFVLHLLDRSFCISCHPLPTLLPTLPCCCKSCAFLTTSSRCVHLSANQNNPNLFVRSTPTRYACRHHRRHFYFPTPLRPSSLAMTPPPPSLRLLKSHTQIARLVASPVLPIVCALGLLLFVLLFLPRHMMHLLLPPSPSLLD